MKLIPSTITFALTVFGGFSVIAAITTEVAGLRCEFLQTPLGIEDAQRPWD